eukprot:jgi/Mesvir1/10162/Mv18042-RA.1
MWRVDCVRPRVFSRTIQQVRGRIATGQNYVIAVSGGKMWDPTPCCVSHCSGFCALKVHGPWDVGHQVYVPPSNRRSQSASCSVSALWPPNQPYLSAIVSRNRVVWKGINRGGLSHREGDDTALIACVRRILEFGLPHLRALGPFHRVLSWCRKGPFRIPSVTGDEERLGPDSLRHRRTVSCQATAFFRGSDFLGQCSDSDTEGADVRSDPGFVGRIVQQLPTGKDLEAERRAALAKLSAVGRDSSNSTTGRGKEPSVMGEVPVYVMLPLDTLNLKGELSNEKALTVALQTLKAIGVNGIMVDVWWGIAERDGPKQYDFRAYRNIMHIVKNTGLKFQAVMAFHACGGNVGDNNTHIPLPEWVMKAAASDPDILYTDRAGHRNRECLSLFADEDMVLFGRTPLQCYEDFMMAFKEAMGKEAEGILTEVAIGMGPSGELRYPAYPEGDGRWRYPGIGEFQCYDRRALAHLRAKAKEVGHDEWGLSGPHDAGHYKNWPHETGFFNHDNGSWESEYGHFFLNWYSDNLLAHGDRILTVATRVFRPVGPDGTVDPNAVKLSVKCAGVHWWYQTTAHAAELTAGYYNTYNRNGYLPIAELCRKHGAHLNFTCVEMRNEDHPRDALCRPEDLLMQVRLSAAVAGVELSGENALCRYDDQAYNRIIANVGSQWTTMNDRGVCGPGEHRIYLPRMVSFSYLRLTPELFEEHHFPRFVKFVNHMKNDVPAREAAANAANGVHQGSLVKQ